VTHGSVKHNLPAEYQLFDVDMDPDEQHDLASEADYADDLERMTDLMLDARCALEDRTEPRIAKF
jgi:hypothetical protein